MPEANDSIMLEAQRAALDEGLASEVLTLDQELCDKIDAAENSNEIVVVLADPWTLRLRKYADHLRRFDRRLSANCAFIVVWNKKDEETTQKSTELEDNLGNIFLNKMTFPPPGHLFIGVDNRDELA